MAVGNNGPAGRRFPAGPWQWRWRRRRRRRRAVGCFLWLVTLVMVLVVLSLLFGGFRRGSRDGGEARLAPVTAIAARSSEIREAGPRAAGPGAVR